MTTRQLAIVGSIVALVLIAIIVLLLTGGPPPEELTKDATNGVVVAEGKLLRQTLIWQTSTRQRSR